jgi:hypothetical protein
VDASASGMCLRMAAPPGDAHQDVLIVDQVGSSLLWVQVLSYRSAVDGGYFWHVRVTGADEKWSLVLNRITTRRTRRSALSRNKRPPNPERGTAAP